MIRIAVVLLSLIAVVSIALVFRPRDPEPKPDGRESTQVAEQEQDSTPVVDQVPNNRGPDVADAYTGDVHPMLSGQGPLELTAHWSPIGTGREQLERQVPESIYAVFRDLTVDVPRRTYTARDFSPLLPAEFEDVGQMWSIELDRVAPFLTQFHSNPSMRAVSRGRRSGPDGAFGVLRAQSPTHFDLVFRWHAEFQLGINMWYTPAYFTGRMVINRQSRSIEHFHVEIPPENTLNVHLTVIAAFDGVSPPDVNREIRHGDEVVTARDIVHVDRMELTDGTQFPEDRQWTDQITLTQARADLKKTFYKFLEIDWVPFTEALARAETSGKPILAAVSWGGLDDQSC